MHRARTGRRIGLAALATVVAGLVVVWRIDADGAPTGGHKAAAPTTAPPTTITTTTTVTTTTVATSTTSTTTPGFEDVFDAAPVAAYLATEAQQSLDVTAAVYDEVTGQTWLYRPTVTLTTASLIKVDILEAMLARAQTDGTTLTTGQQALATSMIEESTDDAASDLWSTVGGATAIEHYDDEVGLTQTDPNTTGYWGLSTTSALDQVRLVEVLASSNTLLSAASRTYEVDLMRDVAADQDWGVSSGVPSGVTVALKDGWDPITGIWQINSDGWIDGNGQDYVVSVLCWGAATETAGIDAIDGLSQLLWQELASPGG